MGIITYTCANLCWPLLVKDTRKDTSVMPIPDLYQLDSCPVLAHFGMSLDWPSSDACCHLHDRSISQIPRCTKQISHNAPCYSRNVHTYAHFCYKMVHRGTWNRCIEGFMIKVNCYRQNGQFLVVTTFWFIFTITCCKTKKNTVNDIQFLTQPFTRKQVINGLRYRQHIIEELRAENPFLHYNDVIMSAMASQITSLTVVYSTVYSGADQRKHQTSALFIEVLFIYDHYKPFVIKISKWVQN